MLPTLERFYRRIEGAPPAPQGDPVSTHEIDADEIRAYLRKIGVGDGVFGARAVEEATAEVMRLLDESGDRKIQWREMVLGGAKLLPADLVDAAGHLDRGRVADVFERIIGKKKKGRDKATAKDLAKFIEPEIRKRADTVIKAMFAPQAALAAAKIGMDALDADGDKAFTKDDLFAIVDDINAQIDRL
jgi:hypothetical protein